MAGSLHWHCVEDGSDAEYTIGSFGLSSKTNGNTILTLEIIGCSMEPTISSGSLVGVDCESKEFVDGEIYIVRVDPTRLLIKRLKELNGILLACSDNKKLFRPFPISRNTIVGRVIWNLKNF